jgi:hypothetical protein
MDRRGDGVTEVLERTVAALRSMPRGHVIAIIVLILPGDLRDPHEHGVRVTAADLDP